MTRLRGARRTDVPSAYLEALAGVALPAPDPVVDLRQWCSRVEDQTGQQCVGESIKGMLVLANGLAGVISKRPSQHGIYTAARARERKRIGDALVDIGCSPVDAFDALVETGCYPEDDIDAEPADINRLETWDEAIAAKLLTADSFAPIASGDIETVKRWLTAGAGVFFAMSVDQTYEDLTGSDAWQGPQAAPLGGHAQGVVGYDAEAMIVRNSWGTGWGDGGYGRIAFDAFARAAWGLVAIRKGVVLE